MGPFAYPTNRTPHLSRADRDEKRRDIVARIGFDPTISEALADEIRDRIGKYWIIGREEYTGLRLTFFVMPEMSSTLRQLHNAEAEMMRDYGNPPHNIATQFEQYKLQFFAN